MNFGVRSRTGWGKHLGVLIVVMLVGLLYADRLDFAPPHLVIDEVLIGLVAHSTASTGRDLNGEFLPLYFQTAEHSWYQPLVVYLTAFVLKFLPLSEWTVRLPTVCIGVLNVLLMYFVARHLFGSAVFGVIAAGLLALTPAHFIHARYGMDYIYPVPFILTWLLCLVRYSERRRAGYLVLGTGILGIGFYSYIASIVMMPVYFTMTCLMLARQEAPRRHYGLAAAGFLPWLMPFLLWVARHPNAYGATIAKYGLYDANQLDAVQGLRSLLSLPSISHRLSLYWDFFNPAFLFVGGGTKMAFSTNQVGVFLLPVAAFVLAGIYHAGRRADVPLHLVVLLGFATAPLAALIVAEESAIFRALSILPFGVLLATMGVQSLWSASATRSLRAAYALFGAAALLVGAAYTAWTLLMQARVSASSVPLIAVGAGSLVAARASSRVRQWRLVAGCLLALIPLQFAVFWSDYFSAYRVRSSVWLGGNAGGAMEEVIERDRLHRAPRVYFSTLKATGGQIDGRDQYMDAYWRFYLIKHDRQDLLARTMRFEPGSVQTVPPGSLVLANLGDVDTESLVASRALTRVATIPELDSSSFFVVLRR